MMLMYAVEETGREDPVPCASMREAMAHAEDRAAEAWDSLRCPNQPARRYPGVEWQEVDGVLTASVDGLQTEWRVLCGAPA